MKIVHVITRLIIGGAQENTVLTCSGLAEKGHDVTLISGPETGPEGSLWDQTLSSGFSTIKVDSLRRAVHPAHDLQAYRELRRTFRDLRPQIVHTHSSKAGILARWAASAAGVPIIIHTVHGMSFNRTQPKLTQALYRWLERETAHCTTAFVCVAQSMVDQCIAANIAPPDRFVVIRSGMETDRFTPSPNVRAIMRQRWGIAEHEIVVGTIARLFENKGYEQIIQAMPKALAHSPNLRFVWVGHGPHRQRYESQLDRLGLRNRVHFTGLIPPAEIPAVLNGFDILVHASRWEGLPRAAVQALLTEVPVVSFDNDGAPEVVIDGETGVLVPSGNVAELESGIGRLATDSDGRHRLGSNGRRRCLESFDWELMIRQIEAMYGELQNAI